MDDCEGLTKFTTNQLAIAQSRLEARRAWLTARGIKFLFVIAPEKQSIYPEHLPAWLKPAAATRTDQFVEYMHLHSTVEVLDLRPVLRLARRAAPVYYQTDPHWNPMGAFVACDTIISRLATQMPGMVPLGRDEFNIQQLSVTGGNLAGMAGALEMVEPNQYAFSPGPGLPKLEIANALARPVDLAQMWSLPVPVQSYVTTNPQGARQAVIYGDSFAVDLVPFLGVHFGKVFSLPQPVDTDRLNGIQPEVVIEEVAERNL